MKIKVLDDSFESEDLKAQESYEVIRTETIRDDLYYIVKNEKNKEVGVHELCAEEIQ